MMPTTPVMAMDSRRIAMVKESFEKVQPYSSKLTRVFYDRLFELNPDLRKLFKKDMRSQRRKFLNIFSYLIDNLHDADNIAKQLRKLAKNHISYGVKKEDYRVFGEALIFALSAALGDDFTDPLKSAWRDVYSTLAQIMIDEAYK